MTYRELTGRFIIDGLVFVRLCAGHEINVIWEKSAHDLTWEDLNRLENVELKSMFPRIDTIDGTPEAVTVLEFVEGDE